MCNAPDFTESPILNSPYDAPTQHWELDDSGQPTNNIMSGRRSSTYLIPIPAARRDRQRQQNQLDLSTDENEERTNEKVNAIRTEVQKWRALTPDKWKVSYVTQRLLTHWREGKTSPRLFYCQIEAAETFIWLNEVAPHSTKGKEILKEITEENDEANPNLFRLAAKMATGSGKTTVMAMLIAYHALNKIRQPKKTMFSNHFLIITPGITIRDRLRVLLPQDPKNYYEDRDIIPPDMRGDIKKANVIITNFHAFIRRETRKLTKKEREILQGNGDEIATLETDTQMLKRISPDLLSAQKIIVINDEAHHCYQRKIQTKADKAKAAAKRKEKLDEDEKEEIKKNNEDARIWINGIRTLGSRAQTIYDLSATPFFLSGAGYDEGKLFPWVVSDYSLMDAIESGIVKLPRVPVEDGTEEEPIYRNLYVHIKDRLPKKGGQQDLDPQALPPELMGALQALYGHYEQTTAEWQEAGIGIPPAFIIACNNTSTSKLIYKYISGYEVNGEWRNGEFDLFNNIGANGTPLARPRTLLIDSREIESGKALSDEFKEAAAVEIELFKKEMRTRHPDRNVDKITDEEMLREVMNTVGKKGQLGEQIRCVVSVYMLTEGWDTNNVTHILGVRKFGTQLLCEQVVGRGLRRYNYDVQEDGKFSPEYADVFGVPFSFVRGKGKTIGPPNPKTRIRHLDERINLAIYYPRVRGYRIKPPETKITANFDTNSLLDILPEMAPPITGGAAIIGEKTIMTLDNLKKRRMKEVEFFLTAYIIERCYKQLDGGIAPARFRDLLPITRQWLGKYVTCKGGTFPQYLLWKNIADLAVERIYRACVPSEDKTEQLLPMLDPYTPEGGTYYVDFLTSKKRLHDTQEDKSHINIAVCDSSWELDFCKLIEAEESVFSYTRNDGLGFEVPYTHEKRERVYLPDFIIVIKNNYGKYLNLVVEIKGFRKGDAQAKADTMNRLWVPAINNHGRYGQWAFEEIMDPQDFRKKLRKYTRPNQPTTQGKMQ